MLGLHSQCLLKLDGFIAELRYWRNIKEREDITESSLPIIWLPSHLVLNHFLLVS